MFERNKTSRPFIIIRYVLYLYNSSIQDPKQSTISDFTI